MRGEDLPAGRLHTLKRPILSDLAARAFFRGGVGSLPYAGPLSADQAKSASPLIQELGQGEAGVEPEAYARYVDQVCAHRAGAAQQCAVLLARWLVREPESEWAQGAASRNLRVAGRASTVSLRDLRLLFGQEGDEEISLGRAERLVGMFEDSYEYTAPFDVEDLRRALARCREPANREGGCEALRVELESRLTD